MSVQVSFKIADVAKIAKINKEMAILKLVLQKNRQKPAKKDNGALIIIKNGATFINKVSCSHCPLYDFQKMAFFHMFLGYSPMVFDS